MWLVTFELQMYTLWVLEEMRVEEKGKQTHKKTVNEKVDTSQRFVWTKHMARSSNIRQFKRFRDIT